MKFLNLFSFLFCFCLVLSMYVFVVPVHAVGLALDGAVNSTTPVAGTFTCNLTTSSSPDVIIMYGFTLHSSYLTVTSVTSVPALTWTRRAQYQVYTNAYEALEEWCANWTSSGNLDITMVWSGAPANQGDAIAFGISGAETTAFSFDSNVVLPKTGFGAQSANPSVLVSTTKTDTFIFGLECNWAGTASVGSGYTAIKVDVARCAEYKVVSVAQTNLPVYYTLASTYWCMIGDAVKAVSGESFVSLHGVVVVVVGVLDSKSVLFSRFGLVSLDVSEVFTRYTGLIRGGVVSVLLADFLGRSVVFGRGGLLGLNLESLFLSWSPHGVGGGSEDFDVLYLSVFVGFVVVCVGGVVVVLGCRRERRRGK